MGKVKALVLLSLFSFWNNNVKTNPCLGKVKIWIEVAKVWIEDTSLQKQNHNLWNKSWNYDFSIRTQRLKRPKILFSIQKYFWCL